MDSFKRKIDALLSLNNGRLFAALLVLAIAPLWFNPYLPMVDMAQHAGQVEALREIWHGNPLFTARFEVNWFTPYLLGYLLLYGLSLVLPITAATQLLVSAAIVCVPIITGMLLRAMGADERWKWLVVPASYSFAFYWGFLSFLVAVPVALLFLLQAVRYSEAPSVRRALALGFFAIALFFCHIIVLGFTGLVAASYILARGDVSARRLLLRLIPLAAPVPLIILWLVYTFNREASVHTDPVVFGPWLDRLTALLIQPSGREAFSPSITTLVTATVAFFPLLQGSRLSRRPERLIPLLVGSLTFLTVPHYVLSTAYVYQRLGVFLVPLWLIAWEPPEQTRRLDWIPIVVVSLWVLANGWRLAAFATEMQSFRKVLAQMEPGHRAASMIVDRTSPHFPLPVYLHMPLWYQAQSAGVVDFNFADFLPQMVRYRRDAGPRISEPVTWYPLQFQWDINGGGTYEYFLVHCRADASNYIFKDRLASVELVSQEGQWWLYRRSEHLDGQ